MMGRQLFMMASPASNGEGNKNLPCPLNFQANVIIFTKKKIRNTTNMLNKTIYIELDNVLCNYNGRIFELRAENDCDDIEQLPIHYKDMKPIDGAIEAVETLAHNLDVYIVTPNEKCEEKTEWVRTHLPQAVDNIIFCDIEETRDGNYLVCMDKKKGGCFRGRFIEYYSIDFPTWSEVVNYIAAKENYDWETSSFFENEDEETLARNTVTRSMVEKTIKHLDAYSKILNAKYGQESDEGLYKEIIEIARLTNQWLEVTGEEDKSDYYNI